MSKDDLSGKNLDHVSLSGADLSDCDLSKASLRRSHLEGASLQNANLAESDLQGAHLDNADVTGAILRDAILVEADLRGVDLQRAATTEGAKLDGAKGVPEDVTDHAETDRVVDVRWDDAPREVSPPFHQLACKIDEANREIADAFRGLIAVCREGHGPHPPTPEPGRTVQRIAELRARRDAFEDELLCRLAHGRNPIP